MIFVWNDAREVWREEKYSRTTKVGLAPEPVFPDTAYVTALVNVRDPWHEIALRWQRKLAADKGRLVTTEFVLVEIAAAVELYRSRPDKDRRSTDYASFVVMRERSLSEALTVDDHFRQAGFRALLLDDIAA